MLRARSPAGPARITGVSGRGELGELLAAAAAGGDDLRAVGDHQHLGDGGAAGGDHGGDGAGLGAGALRIGDVLDVAAGEDAAVGGADGGADTEVGIGCIGIVAGARGGVEEVHGVAPPGLGRDYGRGGSGWQGWGAGRENGPSAVGGVGIVVHGDFSETRCTSPNKAQL